MAKTDRKTLELIETVKRQKAEIASAERPTFKTNCAFSFMEGNKSNTVNLHTATDVKMLIGMAAFLLEKERTYRAAAEALKVESVPSFTWDGYPTQEWLDDIKTRINKIQIGAKRTKLEQLESRLNLLISPELRAELELEAIAGELSK